MQFHKAIFYFNPKMGHMLNLAMVDKLNRAGFVVAPYNTPEEVPSVKSVSGPARHVGEADKRVRDSRGGSPCGENRCGIGESILGKKTAILGHTWLLVVHTWEKNRHTWPYLGF